MACKQPWWLQIGCEVCARVNNTTVLADLQHMLDEDWEVIPHQCVTRKLEEEEEVPGYFRCVLQHSHEAPESFTCKQIFSVQTSSNLPKEEPI